MKNISETLIHVIAENESTFLNDDLLISYESAIKEFDELIKKGFVKRRENNLLSITDIHLHRITLESTRNCFTQQEIDENEAEALMKNFVKTNFSNL